MNSLDIVGLIPAAGTASRIAPLPCSKELYPVGFHNSGSKMEHRPKAVSHYLLEKMRLADIHKAFIILREGKWDIPSYYGCGKLLDMRLSYLMMDLPYGVPYTIDQAYPFIQNSIVALGFPDILFTPVDAYTSLLAKQLETKADVVLGIFPASQPHKTDMVELDDNGRILSFQIKPEKTQLKYTWQMAVWTPSFTHFMHNFIFSRKTDTVMKDVATAPEMFVGDVINAAVKEKIVVNTVIFENGHYLDIGTPDDLVRASDVINEFH